MCVYRKASCNLKCVQLYVDVLARGCLDPKQTIDKQCSNFFFPGSCFISIDGPCWTNFFSSDVIVLSPEFVDKISAGQHNEPAK